MSMRYNAAAVAAIRQLKSRYCRAQVRSLVHPARTVHQVHEPDIVLKSRTTAEGIWPMHDVVVWPEGVAAPVPFRAMEGFGFYHEKYRRIRDALVHRLARAAPVAHDQGLSAPPRARGRRIAALAQPGSSSISSALWGQA
jgi:hypothetical protein